MLFSASLFRKYVDKNKLHLMDYKVCKIKFSSSTKLWNKKNELGIKEKSDMHENTNKHKKSYF